MSFEELEKDQEHTKQMLLKGKKVKFNAGVNILEVPLENIAELSKDKHHRLNVLVDPIHVSKKITVKLGRIDKEDYKAFSVFLTYDGEVTTPIRLTVSLTLKTYTCTLQDMQKLKDKAEKEALFLNSYLNGGKSEGEDKAPVDPKQSIGDLINDVNDLFGQAKFGTGRKKRGS